jgi:Holliday junction resolvasome RuvABC DNA-binding subunit
MRTTVIESNERLHHRPSAIRLARKALQQSGYKAQIAERAVREAAAHVGADADLAALIKEAFRRCL